MKKIINNIFIKILYKRINNRATVKEILEMILKIVIIVFFIKLLINLYSLIQLEYNVLFNFYKFHVSMEHFVDLEKQADIIKKSSKSISKNELEFKTVIQKVDTAIKSYYLLDHQTKEVFNIFKR